MIRFRISTSSDSYIPASRGCFWRNQWMIFVAWSATKANSCGVTAIVSTTGVAPKLLGCATVGEGGKGEGSAAVVRF